MAVTINGTTGIVTPDIDSVDATFTGPVSGAVPAAIDVNASAPADSVAIDASGNVGIRTTSPSHLLHVLATAAGETTVKFESNQAGAMFVALDVDTDRDCLLQFQEAGTTRWDIFMNGSSGTNPLLIRDDGGVTQGSFDQSGNFKFNSGYGSAATAYACRAWAKFQGSGTVGLSQGGNVSTVGDNGTGDYTVNFSTAMPDVDYCAVTSGHENIGTYTRDLVPAGNYGTTSVRVRVYGGLYDISVANVAIFR